MKRSPGDYTLAIVSDGSWHVGFNGALLMRDWFICHEVPSRYVVCETGSADTYENLLLSAPKGGRDGVIWVIPTEPTQFRRFVETAAALGIRVENIPVPVELTAARRIMEKFFLLLHTVDPLGDAWWNQPGSIAGCAAGPGIARGIHDRNKLHCSFRSARVS